MLVSPDVNSRSKGHETYNVGLNLEYFNPSRSEVSKIWLRSCPSLSNFLKNLSHPLLILLKKSQKIATLRSVNNRTKVPCTNYVNSLGEGGL